MSTYRWWTNHPPVTECTVDLNVLAHAVHHDIIFFFIFNSGSRNVLPPAHVRYTRVSTHRVKTPPEHAVNAGGSQDHRSCVPDWTIWQIMQPRNSAKQANAPCFLYRVVWSIRSVVHVALTSEMRLNKSVYSQLRSRDKKFIVIHG